MLTLEQWINASTQQRSQWLIEDRELDNHSSMILNWAICFQDCGATITDDNMLRLYHSGQLA